MTKINKVIKSYENNLRHIMAIEEEYIGISSVWELGLQPRVT